MGLAWQGKYQIESTMEQTHRHPEWKRLIDECGPEATPGRFYTMEELSLRSGLDIRSHRGRGQFQRFRKAMLLTYNLWLENERGEGYRVVQPHEHSRCAGDQLKRARRRIRQGVKIAQHTRVDQLTDDGRRENADVLCRLARIESTAAEVLKEVRKITADAERKRLPSPVLN